MRKGLIRFSCFCLFFLCFFQIALVEKSEAQSLCEYVPGCASYNLNPLLSGWGTATIDGNMTSGEWDGAGTKNISLNNGYPATIRVMNDHDYLYMALTFLTPIHTSDQVMYITFDGDLNGEKNAGEDVLWFNGEPPVSGGIAPAVIHDRYVPVYSEANIGWTFVERTSISPSTTESFTNVAYGNGVFVTGGSGGSIYSSVDSIDWVRRAYDPPVMVGPDLTDIWMGGVAYGNGIFVIVAAAGHIHTSPDGINWTLQASGVTQNLERVTYGKGNFVAVGDGGVILTSPDGINWTSRTSGTTEHLYGVVFGNIPFFAGTSGVFFATGNNGEVLQSYDSITWSHATDPHFTTESLTTINVKPGVNGFFLIAAWNGYIYKTFDGISWVAYDISSQATQLGGLSFGNGTFMISAGGGGKILTSDAIGGNAGNWTTRYTSPTPVWLAGTAYTKENLFIVVGSNGKVLQVDPFAGLNGGREDLLDGGTDDWFARSQKVDSLAGTTYTYEMRMPLHSGDVSHDFQLVPPLSTPLLGYKLAIRMEMLSGGGVTVARDTFDPGIFTYGVIGILEDTDADGIPDVNDNCPTVPNSDQVDTDGNGIGDACETLIFNDNFNVDTPSANPNPSPVGSPSGDSITSNCSVGGFSPPVACGATEFWVEPALAYMPSPHLAVKKMVNTPRISFHPDSASATGSVFTISWRSASDGSNDVMFDLYTSGRGGPAARVAYGTNGNIYSPANSPALAAYTEGTSQFFSLVANLSSGRYDLFIDGIKKVTGASLLQSNNSGSFDTGSLVLWENTSGKQIRVDDIRMYRGVDSDGDGIPDAGFVDSDGDGVPDSLDNCPFVANSNQADNDGDGVGDACDNCPPRENQNTYNPDQADTDGDGIGNICDACPLISGSIENSGCTSVEDLPSGRYIPPCPAEPCPRDVTGSIPVTTCWDLNSPAGLLTFPPDPYNTFIKLGLPTGFTTPPAPYTLAQFQELLNHPKCLVGPPYVFGDPIPGLQGLKPATNPDDPNGEWCVTINVADLYEPFILKALAPNPGDTATVPVQIAHGQFVRDTETCAPGGFDPNGLPCYTNVWYGFAGIQDQTIKLDNKKCSTTSSSNCFVGMDMMPGTIPNVIIKNSNATVPVTILSQKDPATGQITFDATKLTQSDLLSIRLKSIFPPPTMSGQPAITIKDKKLGTIVKVEIVDTNKDGVKDIMIFFENLGKLLAVGEHQIQLEGNWGAKTFTGSDMLVVKP